MLREESGVLARVLRCAAKSELAPSAAGGTLVQRWLGQWVHMGIHTMPRGCQHSKSHMDAWSLQRAAIVRSPLVAFPSCRTGLSSTTASPRHGS